MKEKLYFYFFRSLRVSPAFHNFDRDRMTQEMLLPLLDPESDEFKMACDSGAMQIAKADSFPASLITKSERISLSFLK